VPHPHEDEDPNAKADVAGFQEEFLREVGEAVAAGFKPEDEDPVIEDDLDKLDAMWEGVGQ
jgi:hypothetical protein